MSIIEHVWDHLDKRVRKRLVKPSNKEELWKALQEEWENMDIQFIRNLYLSIPHHLKALRNARGSYTKY
jgi:hypothetical protein